MLIEKYYRLLCTQYALAEKDQRAITPAAEWLLDNFHVVEEQITDIHEHLPDQFYRELPKLADGPLAGYPRVYGMSWAFVAHTDSRFSPEQLIGFVAAYQEVAPLTMGEIWALTDHASRRDDRESESLRKKNYQFAARPATGESIHQRD